MRERRNSQASKSIQDYRNLVHQVHHRDSWQCRNPVCKGRKNLHNHHIVFRSHGGEDSTENCLTLCQWCHDSIHKLNPKTGAKLVICSLGNGRNVNADVGVMFVLVDGWRPQCASVGRPPITSFKDQVSLAVSEVLSHAS